MQLLYNYMTITLELYNGEVTPYQIYDHYSIPL
jgi:hypothetical protein